MSDEDVQHVAVKDIEVGYVTHGRIDGPRLVLLHGLGQDHNMWLELQRSLASCHTIACDLRGHGASSLGIPAGNIQQLAEDLIGFLESVGPAVVVGFSLGGVIALWAAAERPDSVTRVVAVATSSVVGRAAADAMAERIAIFRRGDPGEVRASMIADTKSQLSNQDVDPVKIAAARLTAIGDRLGYVNGATAVCSMREDPLQDRLPRVSVPVLIVSGESDSWCPKRAADIMLEALTHATYVELAGVGHLMMDDDPSTLTEVVRNWLGLKNYCG